MKLEFFPDAFEGDGLLLLYSGSPSEVESLRAQVRQLAASGSSIRVHALDFIDAPKSCELTFSCVKPGRGVQTFSGGSRFELHLDSAEWERVVDLLEPFCHAVPDANDARFQYLHEHGGVEVIYSTERGW